MNFVSNFCLIVDGYSSGRFLPLELKKYGFDCVHVQSTQIIPECYRASFYKENFITNIIYEGNIEKTLEDLSKYNISFLMVATESGVEFADFLSEKMGLPSNGTRLSKARRNKFEMAEAIRKAGLKSVNHIKSSSVDVILAWANDQGTWPVVLKPLDSLGTDNVIFCKNEADIASAFKRIIESKNRIDKQNTEVLGQQFLHGTEYFVNTVSSQGKHYVTEIWQYFKRTVPGAAYIYDMEKILPFDGDIQADICNYVYHVLDALEISFGPAHTEVMMTNDGPVLIETGARLGGSMISAAASNILEFNQVELAVESYVDCQKFLTRIGKPYLLRYNAIYVSLISEQEGIVRSLSRIDEIKQLPSFFDMHLSITVGSQLKKTVNSFTCPGFVYLIHDNLEVLRQDYHAIRTLERNGIYEVE